jgi:hypothetical protein
MICNKFSERKSMKRYVNYAMIALLATIAVSNAAPPGKAAMEEKEKAAWQAFKDKNEAEFKKLVDKDIRCVYDTGASNMAKELDGMKKWDMKSFAISDYDIFSDEKDVIVSTYTVKVEGTFDGKDMSGTYNAGSVWKKEGNNWLAIFHTNIKQAVPQ